jgi:hypothetical protein
MRPRVYTVHPGAKIPCGNRGLASYAKGRVPDRLGSTRRRGSRAREAGKSFEFGERDHPHHNHCGRGAGSIPCPLSPIRNRRGDRLPSQVGHDRWAGRIRRARPLVISCWDKNHSRIRAQFAASPDSLGTRRGARVGLLQTTWQEAQFLEKRRCLWLPALLLALTQRQVRPPSLPRPGRRRP